jgi:hypothetical protein
VRHRFLASTAAVVLPGAFFNTNSGSKLYVCATPQNSDLSQAQYEALAWVLVTGTGSVGEIGSSTNILTYDTWDNAVVQKAKGLTDAGSPEIECARIPTDPGQNILRAAGLTNFSYAFKIERNDKLVPTGTGTIRYNRGLVTGPKEPQGRNEDFDLEVFTLGLQQLQITVDPSGAGNPPVLTVAPAITGTAQVNNVLTASAGTFTGDAVVSRQYYWMAGGAAAGGTNGGTTYIPVAADVGKIITVRVTAFNAAGNAVGTSAPTTAVIA